MGVAVELYCSSNPLSRHSFACSANRLPAVAPVLSLTPCQAALPAISPALADDEVVDVVAARPTRVVLLTRSHLAYIYATRRSQAPSSSSASSSQPSAASSFSPDALSVSYRVKWIIRNDRIDNVRSLDRGFTITVEYHTPVRLGRINLKLPLRRGMRAVTAEGHKNLIHRLNRHIGHTAGAAAAAGGGGVAATLGLGPQGVRVEDLLITTAPRQGQAAGFGVGRAGHPAFPAPFVYSAGGQGQQAGMQG